MNSVQQVVAELEDLIFGGQEPGTPLPSESELAQRLGVSRLTVREGVKTLQARGLIIVHHGRRPVIAPPGAGPMSDFFSAIVRREPGKLIDLLEVRRGVEVQIAELAAARVSRDTLAALHLALDSMRAAVDAEDQHALNEADLRFHEAVAVAAGNEILQFLIEGMAGPLQQSRMQSLRGHLSRGRTMGDVLDEHIRILERIEARDADGAATAMEMHLAATEHSLRAAMLLREPAEQ